MLEKLHAALDTAFQEIANEFKAKGIKVLMPTFAPQQGRLMSEFAKAANGNAFIAGGKNSAPMFKNVRQYGQDFDTSAYLNIFPKGMCEKLLGAVPDDVLKDKKIALFTFIPPKETWTSHIEKRGLNTTVVATNEQNTRGFFENKGNLVHILSEAGLEAYSIPTQVVEPHGQEAELRAVYDRLKNEDGKVVVQPCVENYEQTAFYDNVQDFMKRMTAASSPLKVVRFVEGSEANFSFFVANTRPADVGRGVTKTNLPQGVDINNPHSLAVIEANAAQKGIDASNVFSVSGRATLKAVGDVLLSNARCDSVGNNIGHIYDAAISRQITDIGRKLGMKMGLCGKVGLAGADLIIDKQGKVWINEINDRQQGPTDQMSADAEAAGLPGLSRMAWFAHFADFSKPANQNLMQALRENADAVHQRYMTSRASFYIKVYATHAEEFDGKVTAQKDVPAGLYTVTKGADGAWKWERAAASVKERAVDIASGAITVKISSGSLSAGDHPPSGAEMFRITGVAGGENSPFVIENGVSRLSPQWEPLIERLYKDCFGEDYLAKNPMRRADAPTAKNAPKKPASDAQWNGPRC